MTSAGKHSFVSILGGWDRRNLFTLHFYGTLRDLSGLLLVGTGPGSVPKKKTGPEQYLDRLFTTTGT